MVEKIYVSRFFSQKEYLKTRTNQYLKTDKNLNNYTKTNHVCPTCVHFGNEESNLSDFKGFTGKEQENSLELSVKIVKLTKKMENNLEILKNQVKKIESKYRKKQHKEKVSDAMNGCKENAITTNCDKNIQCNIVEKFLNDQFKLLNLSDKRPSYFKPEDELDLESIVDLKYHLKNKNEDVAEVKHLHEEIKKEIIEKLDVDAIKNHYIEEKRLKTEKYVKNGLKLSCDNIKSSVIDTFVPKLTSTKIVIKEELDSVKDESLQNGTNIKNETKTPDGNINSTLYVNDTFGSKFKPPKSPHNLIEEELYHNPWQLLVATIFLNKTSCRTARPYIFWFLDENPSPKIVLEKKVAELEQYFLKLGLQRTRATQVWRMSYDFLYKPWRNAKELYGIGRYGQNAFRMFCLGDFNVEPKDRFLKIYKAWFKMEEKKGRN